MLRKYREAQKEEGFTLIELLVVVLIIGILAAIAIPVFLDQRAKAYRDAVGSDMRNLAVIVEDFAGDNNGAYPASVTFSGTPGGTVELSDGGTTPVTETFQLSDGVTINGYVVATGASGGYCYIGTHNASALAGESWRYDTRGKVNSEVEHDTSGTALTC